MNSPTTAHRPFTAGVDVPAGFGAELMLAAAIAVAVPWRSPVTSGGHDHDGSLRATPSGVSP